MKVVAFDQMPLDGKMGIDIVAVYHYLCGVQKMRKILAIHQLPAQKNAFIKISNNRS